MLLKLLSGKKNGLIAGLLMLAICLPLCPGALAVPPPSAPESFTAIPGNGKVGLMWFEPENDGGAAITGYQVSMDGGATWIDVGLATSYTFDGLTGGIMYVFMVQAVNDAGYGEEAVVTAKPKDAKPDVNATGNQQGQGQVITGGGGGGGIIVEPPPPPPPPPEDDPPEDPSPKKDTPKEPQPEDYIPIEIDPAEVTERPFRIVKPKIMDLVGTYTIIASGTQPYFIDQAHKHDYTLDFKAIKTGDAMSGSYSGNGTLRLILDEPYYHTNKVASSKDVFHIEFEATGPLTNISFALLTPLPPIQPANNSGGSLQPLPPIQPADNSGSGLQPLPPIQSVGNSGSGLTPLPPIQPANNSGGSLTPLPPIQPADNSGGSLTPLPPIQPANNSGSSLTPLPPIKPIPPAQATGTGTMYWNPSTVKNRFDSNHGVSGIVMLPFEPFTMNIEVRMFANGNGLVTIIMGSQRLTYKARLVKGVTLVNVK
ncbi:MAG: fibronectin type III domain-containing protein [Clostridia bacterium]|nr:fibronectin type III domain-containing protein [Clostridia bacterium]